MIDPYQLPPSQLGAYIPSAINQNVAAYRHTASSPSSSIFPDFSSSSNIISNSIPTSHTLPLAPPQSALVRRQTMSHAPSSSAPGAQNGGGGGGSKKRRTGRGRMMMVKVLYSLASPRFSDNNNINNNASSSSLPYDSTTTSSVGSTESSNTSQGQQHSYTCLARLSSPVWVQLLGPAPVTFEDEDNTEYGRLTLKTCLSAICISRPELVTDSAKDYAVAAVDPYESSMQPSAPYSAPASNPTSHQVPSGGQGLMEGKGMLSWNLAEKREGTTWVCGRVAKDPAGSRRVRRKLNTTGSNIYDMEDPEADKDDEITETLEVWLQLVERPSFTQTQFLSSLRSFANPAQPAPSSDRASPPPRQKQLISRAIPTIPSSSSATVPSSRRVSLGDPVKKKRPRPSDPTSLRGAPVASSSNSTKSQPSSNAHASFLVRKSTASASAALPLVDPAALASLPAPQVLALLSQLDLSTPQGIALIPAIQTLAQFYGIEIPTAQSSSPPLAAPKRPKDIGVDDLQAVTSKPIASAGTTKATVTKLKGVVELGPMAKGKGKAKRGEAVKEQFNPVKNGDGTSPAGATPSGTVGDAKKGGISFLLGCANCRRKKSTVWRESTEDGEFGETKKTVCNACGVYFNKNGHHRAVNDKTSPAAAKKAKSISVSRPLKGQLTATCESELLSQKSKAGLKKRKATGLVAPPSPSKTVGPRHSPTHQLNSIFRSPGRVQAPGFTMTSPGRSPLRRSPRSHGFGLGVAATSPIRSSSKYSFGMKTHDHDIAGKKSDYDFSAMYSGHQSPSPARRRISDSASAVPSYLLTDSPGTALKRILSDTNIDLGGFDTPFDHDMKLGGLQDEGRRPNDFAVDAESVFSGNGGVAAEMNFFLRSSSEEEGKENERPSSAGTGMISSITTLATQSTALATDEGVPSTDFDSILSSLRRDFSTRLSSNALTAPSSPPLSSPCVQPRTSSATPGTKGKAPHSSGRPAPSILDSYLDGLVPALVLDPEDPIKGSRFVAEDVLASEEEDWTTPGGGEEDLTMRLLNTNNDEDHHGPRSAHRYRDLSDFLSPSHFIQDDAGSSMNTMLPNSFSNDHNHLSAPSDQVHSDFDFGSLPPSSPPALPEAFTTPSDLGFTPDAAMESDAEGLSQHDTVAALLTSLGLPSSAWNSSDAASLDPSAVQQLLQQLIAAKSQQDENRLTGGSSSDFDRGGKTAVGGIGEKSLMEKVLVRKSSMDEMFDLFSEGAAESNCI